MWIIKENVKIILGRIIFKLLWIFPIKKYIFFSSYEGRQYSCNPKAIYEQIIKNNEFEDYEFIWEYNSCGVPVELLNNKRVSIVKHNTIQYILAIMKSKFIITNSGINPIFPLRKKQVLLNTWHGGGAYKKVGNAIKQKINGTTNYALKLASKQTKYFIASSELFKKIMKASLYLKEEQFLNIGMPRNDIFFFNNKVMNKRKKIRDIFNIPDEYKILLYAPTFKSSEVKKEQLDFVEFCKSLEKAYQCKWVVFVRGHYNSDKKLFNMKAIDVSGYSDMQDLLCSADVLVTDYSSCIWDFSFLNRPVFLYVPDLNEYKNERNFYTDIKSWPGIIIENNNLIKEKVLNFNQEKFTKKQMFHKDLLGNFEQGNASLKIIKILKQYK